MITQFNNKHIFNKLSTFSIYLLIMFLLSCTSKSKVIGNANIEVVDIESSLENFSIVKLSDYADDIRYIPLETSDSVLISGISKVIYERETIYILDHTEQIFLFNNEGKYLRTFSRRGRGPGEYSDLFSFGVNPDNGDIFILDSWRGVLRYDSDFRFIKLYPFLDDGSTALMFEITGEDEIAFSLADLINQKHSVVCYGKDTSEILFQKEPHYDFEPDKRENFTFLYHKLYLHKNQLRYYYPFNDTIYSLSHDYKEEAKYYIKIGKYREKADISKEDYNSGYANIISPYSYFESENLIFMSFVLRGFCKEPISNQTFNKEGALIDVFSTFDYAIYDKQKREVKFLLHPETDKRGMTENLLSGPPFWPLYISSNQQYVSYIDSRDLLSFFDASPPGNNKLKELDLIIKEDSNPVIIIASSK